MATDLPGAVGGGALAYDVSAIDKLKYTATKQSDGGVHAAARQFEAMFIKQMLSSMRKAIPDSHLLGDTAADKQYQDMMDAQWSQTLAQRGMGLAKMLDQQLTGHAGHSTEAKTATAPTIGRAAPKPLAASESLAAIDAQRKAAAALPEKASAPLVPASGVAVVDATGEPAAPLLSFNDAVNVADDGASQHVRDFVNKLAAPATRAGDRTGLSPRLILAQAALETGWGRHEITTDSGAPSFNVFNIKAEGWGGAATQVATHEYADGQRQATQAGFRVYDSYDQAFSDYARLIDSSPRYAAARTADSPQAAARALQKGGYATDPQYADKLVAVMQAIPDTARGGLFAGAGGAVVDMDSARGSLVSA